MKEGKGQSALNLTTHAKPFLLLQRERASQTRLGDDWSPVKSGFIVAALEVNQNKIE